MPTLNSLPVDVEVQPLKQWPAGYDRTPEEERTNSDFPQSGILDRTLNDLKRELGHLEPETCVLQVDISPAKIRKDGLPYRNAVIGDHDPGVVLTFEVDGETHTYPCDTYRSWEENLRAIAYVLHDLRRISRHGVGHGSEQYRGYTALPADVDERMGPEEAARLLIRTAPEARGDLDVDVAAQVLLDDRESFRDTYREAAGRSHPDRVGNDAHFKRVQLARDVLEKHHEERENRLAAGAGA
jgi:hypothetical protein